MSKFYISQIPKVKSFNENNKTTLISVFSYRSFEISPLHLKLIITVYSDVMSFTPLPKVSGGSRVHKYVCSPPQSCMSFFFLHKSQNKTKANVNLWYCEALLTFLERLNLLERNSLQN